MTKEKIIEILEGAKDLNGDVPFEVAVKAISKMAENIPPEQTRVFAELVVEYPDPELCTYKEYKGKPYYSIKYIENGNTYVGYGTYNPEVLSQYLKEYFISSSQPERKKWIPCSKRLPEEYTDVLCCDIHGEYIIGMPYADDDSDTGFSVENDGQFMIDCVAWMPLPEPYREESR